MDSRTKTAIVTGAGSGIGRASALALLGEGYNVVLAGRRPEALEETAARGERAGLPGRALTVPTDVPVESSAPAPSEGRRGVFAHLVVLYTARGGGALRVRFEVL